MRPGRELGGGGVLLLKVATYCGQGRRKGEGGRGGGGWRGGRGVEGSDDSPLPPPFLESYFPYTILRMRSVK